MYSGKPVETDIADGSGVVLALIRKLLLNTIIVQRCSRCWGRTCCVVVFLNLLIIQGVLILMLIEWN